MKNRFLLWFLIILSIMIVMQNFGKGKEVDSTLTENDLGMATSKMEYALGKEILLTVQNNTDDVIGIEFDCPDSTLPVYFYDNGDWTLVPAIDPDLECEQWPLYELGAGESVNTSYKNWAYRQFSEYGRYKIETIVDIDGEERTFSSNEFTIKSRNAIGTLWLQGLYRPILNTLVYLVKVIPGHSLGFAIIILTLIIRTILLVPSHRAMRAQKKMQEIQPKLEALKKKYKDNQEKLAMETMNLWKTNKVSPFGSCLPILVQFPIMIALYYVVREGLHIDKTGLLYNFVGDGFSIHEINSNFLGILELMDLNILILPLIVGGLQFIQMHLAMARAQKKKEAKKNTKGKDIAKKVEGQKDMQNEMQMATNMMKYFMPVMIAFFTASLPAGVGLYWGVSTLYGIGQQLIVNREKPSKTSPSEATVRVIDK